MLFVAVWDEVETEWFTQEELKLHKEAEKKKKMEQEFDLDKLTAPKKDVPQYMQSTSRTRGSVNTSSFDGEGDAFAEDGNMSRRQSIAMRKSSVMRKSSTVRTSCEAINEGGKDTKSRNNTANARNRDIVPLPF